MEEKNDIKKIIARVRGKRKEKKHQECATRNVRVMPMIQVHMRRYLPGDASEGMLYPFMECGGIPACNQEQNDILKKLVLAAIDPDEESIESIMINNRPSY